MDTGGSAIALGWREISTASARFTSFGARRIRHWRPSRRRSRSTGTKGICAGQAGGLTNIGNIYLDEGRLDSAHFLFFRRPGRPRATSRRRGPRNPASADWTNLPAAGRSRGGAGRLPRGAFYTSGARETEAQAETLDRMARIFFSRGRLDSALVAYQAGLALYRRYDSHPGKRAQALDHIGDVHLYQGRWIRRCPPLRRR